MTQGPTCRILESTHPPQFIRFVMLALHSCEFCEETFRTRSRLSNHNRKRHQQRVKVRFLNGTVREITRGSDGTFSCQCERVFGHPGSLHTHAKQCGEVQRDEVVEFGDGDLLLDEDDTSEPESGGEGMGILTRTIDSH